MRAELRFVLLVGSLALGSCGGETGGSGGSAAASGGRGGAGASATGASGASTSSGASSCGWDAERTRYTCEGQGEDPAQVFPRACSGEGAGSCPGPQATCCGPDGVPRVCFCPDCEGCTCSWQIVECPG